MAPTERPARSAGRPAADKQRPAGVRLPPAAALITDADFGLVSADTAAELDLDAPMPEIPAGGTPLRPRLKRLIVVRESSVYNRRLLAHALRVAIERNRDAPHLDQVINAGLRPLDEPTRCEFQVQQLSGTGGFRGVYFEPGDAHGPGGTGWLICPASAKLADPRGDNAFTSCLVARLQESRPIVLDSAEFSRLVRALEHSGLLHDACTRNVDVVQVGDQRLDFARDGHLAHVMWTMLALGAASEHNESRRRMVAGELTKYTDGGWVPRSVPPGYLMDTALGRPRPNFELSADITEMLRILTARLPQSTAAQRLLQLDMFAGRGAPASPGSWMRTLIRWIPLLLSGRCVLTFRNTVHDGPDFMGLLVHGRPDPNTAVRPGEPRVFGYFRLEYDLGTPYTGPDDLADAALELSRAWQTRTRVGGRCGGYPLTGTRWHSVARARGATAAAVLEWRLSNDDGKHVTRVRVATDAAAPASAARVGTIFTAGAATGPDRCAGATVIAGGSPYRPVPPAWGSNPDTWSAEHGRAGLAMMVTAPDRLGRGIAFNAADALADDAGVRVHAIDSRRPLQRPDPGADLLPARDLSELPHLEAIRAHARRAADGARKGAELADDEDNRRALVRDADAAERAAKEATVRIERWHREPPGELTLPAPITAPPITLALSRLAAPDPARPLLDNWATQQVVRNLVLMPDGLLIWVRFVLAIVTAGRQVELGPIVFRLPNEHRGAAMLVLQRNGLNPVTLAPAFRSRAQRQQLVADLQIHGCPEPAAELAASAYFAPVTEILLDQRRLSDPDPAWQAPGWQRHLRATYRGAGRVGGLHWVQLAPARQALAYAVADAGDPLAAADVAAVLRTYGAAPTGAVHQYTVAAAQADARGTSSASWPAAVVRQPASDRNWVAVLRRCPACGRPADRVCNVPELPYATLCRCGGAPGLPPDVRVPGVYHYLAPDRAMLAAYAAALTDPWTAWPGPNGR